jgi:DNA end-binding protein Ku
VRLLQFIPERFMSARAIWKGGLKIGTDTVPVKLYSAVEDKSVHFHILEKKTLTRVKQQMIHAETEEPVDSADLQKGLEVEPGTFVILKPAELAGIEREASRQIEITRFVAPEKINHQWYDRPYYLGPDGDSPGLYFALAKALEDSGLEGVARWVMRKKHYAGALQSYGGYLALVTLRHSEEVLAAKELPKPSGRAPDPREIQMAEQLVSALADEFRPEDYKDEYRGRVLKFIESKAAGKRLKLMPAKSKEATTSLMDALSASLKKTKRGGGKAVA